MSGSADALKALLLDLKKYTFTGYVRTIRIASGQPWEGFVFVQAGNPVASFHFRGDKTEHGRAALKARGLFFLDSVTSGRTVGFAIARELGMPARINNVFCDHYETDQDSRQAVLQLARDAASAGGAIGIGHVFHPYVLHVLVQLAPQLQARGYVFAPISQVTDAPAPGLDAGVRSSL